MVPVRNRHPALVRGLPAAALVMGLAAGCGPAHSAPAADPNSVAPSPSALRVVASAYPLAVLANYIGGDKVTVTDLAPPLVQPADLALTKRAAALVRRAGLVVVVGDGYQPAIEAAAARARHHAALLPAVSSRALPYEFWLDPSLMSKAASVLAAAMASADPAGARQFHNGARDMASVASSLSSDLQSNFANCMKQDFVTEDGAFTRMATAFGLHDVAANKVGVSAAAAVVRHNNLSTIFSEAGVGSSAIEQVAAETGASIKVLDPMEVAPSPGTKPLDYFGVMEEDLTYLETGLACDTSANFS